MTNVSDSDRVFAGSVPQLYERYMVPLIFQPYANDMGRAVAACQPRDVLEIAAGTGVVTRRLAAELPGDAAIVATDLNQAMLDEAARKDAGRAITWRQADAMKLPFDDASFDVVVCQFGAMFFPNRADAYAEARRVLRPRGTFFFNVWDKVETNDFVATMADALAALFPDNPPRFMHRGPHGYHDHDAIRADVEGGGFGKVQLETVTHASRAARARDAAIGYCHGTPWRGEIESHGDGALDRATDACTAAMEKRFGTGTVEGRIQAIVVRATRD
jgi:SAM-dependent methyltransferase